MDKLKWFKKVYIESDVQNSEVAERARSLFPKDKVEVIDSNFFKKGQVPARSILDSKKILLLKKFRGSFFKRCPGAKPNLVCCNYYVLNLGQNCEMDCSYCYLQSFINLPAVVIYTNIQDAFQELDAIKARFQDQYLRIGTGEQIDSLSLDDISLYSKKLLDYFYSCPNWKLEFKTKSDNIKNFENLKHKGNIVVSWSINPEYIVSKEEHGTSSLKSRLQACKRARDKGFPVSLHIDPMVMHPEWKQNYAGLVDQILQVLTPKDVMHISIGALRFQPEQRAIMRKRFSMQSLVCQGEFFRGKDGKLRYDQNQRQEMFDFIYKRFRAHSKEWPIFLCMETPESWMHVSQTLPKKQAKLERDFDLKITAKAIIKAVKLDYRISFELLKFFC